MTTDEIELTGSKEIGRVTKESPAVSASPRKPLPKLGGSVLKNPLRPDDCVRLGAQQRPSMIRAKIASAEAPMKTVYRLRGWLMVPPMIFIALCTAGETENELAAFGAGGILLALGIALRVWSQIHLHYRLHVRKVLTMTGPYAFVRNPIYIGNTLMLVGACMFAELFWFVPIYVLYCAVIYSLVVRYEERHLTEKYGAAYVEYALLVPRWFPRFGLPRTSTGKGFFKKFFVASLLPEAHNLLLLVPFIIKEMVC